MMALIGLILFTAALGAVAGVLVLTLWPALPRMAALLSGTADATAAVIAPVERRTARRVVSMPSVQGQSAWPIAA